MKKTSYNRTAIRVTSRLTRFISVVLLYFHEQPIASKQILPAQNLCSITTEFQTIAILK
jgi:hypothetical protein